MIFSVSTHFCWCRWHYLPLFQSITRFKIQLFCLDNKLNFFNLTAECDDDDDDDDEKCTATKSRSSSSSSCVHRILCVSRSTNHGNRQTILANLIEGFYFWWFDSRPYPSSLPSFILSKSSFISYQTHNIKRG